MKNTEQLTTSTFFHIYNRGVDGRKIFESNDNKQYFLQKYSDYIGPIADTHAFCLLDNHFHFLIQIKSEHDINEFVEAQSRKPSQDISKILSLQFSHFFNGYTQAFNKKYNRKGKLFELPFRRVAVREEDYFTRLVFYIHSNPQKHGLTKDFRQWTFSSYKGHLSDRTTQLQRDSVLGWFGDREAYLKFHDDLQDTSQIHHLILE